MIYRHKITGAVIDVESTMGGDWEPVKTPNHPAHAADQEAGKAEEQPATEKAEEQPATEKAEEQPATEKAEEQPATEKAEEQPATEKAVKKNGRGVRNSK